MITAIQLKERHRAVRDSQDVQTSTRFHRAISWLIRAEQETSDNDARFIFQWVALNATYAREFGNNESERERFRQFVNMVLALDTEKTIHNALYQRFSGPIRTLINNKFVFEPFWVALRTHDPSNSWEARFADSNELAFSALLNNKTAVLLEIVFSRLYVLRNQLVHGGATWNSRVNRHQVKDGANILGTILPLIISVMLDHPQHDFGEVLYPVVCGASWRQWITNPRTVPRTGGVH